MPREADFHYTVRGSWPFPLDMLRRDGSKAATPEDEAIIERLTKDHAEDRDAIRNAVTVNLVIPNANRHMRPLTARWQSWGWDVPDDEEHRAIMAERAKRDRMRKLYASAMAKLTQEEREAFDWFRPSPHH
ncbi:hypothetical protein G6L37_07055 [Agrobacterium rubi]|nr:hypothetical protein [Agrobacterium rubi]NTF25124.1 hypothetical protein [Agrobacterium rubi]